MVRNGEHRPEILELFGGSVLGLPWDTAKDTIVIKMVVNLSARKQGVRIGKTCILETRTSSGALC